MLCALTVRKLKPGTLEEFKEAFIPIDAPPGWTRFYALRNVEDEDEVITFGFFDGTSEELRASHSEDAGDYEQRRRAAQQLVDSVGANGIYEVLEQRSFGRP
jgi:heme-degrading monooxygenase HmoA